MVVHFEKTEDGIIIQMLGELTDSSTFASGDTVEVSRENGRVVISRPDDPHYTIEDLLEGMTEEHLHPEISAGPPRGNEIW